jgi:uncharacterized membrane protein YeiH
VAPRRLFRLDRVARVAVARSTPGAVLATVDLATVAVFAVEGASQAADRHLDIFGVLVLAFATALTGGIIRDVLLADPPPTTLRVYRSTIAVVLAGVAVLLLHRQVHRINADGLAVQDAAGLARCTVSGAAKALTRGVNPLTAVLLGVLTGVGGGVVRGVS